MQRNAKTLFPKINDPATLETIQKGADYMVEIDRYLQSLWLCRIWNQQQ
jgi:hypothetical protein